jgi:hypothetical protein
MNRWMHRWFLWSAIALAFLVPGVWFLLHDADSSVSQIPRTIATAPRVTESIASDTPRPAAPAPARPEAGHVTQANFEEIGIGMSRDEVDTLLGRAHRFVIRPDGEELRSRFLSQPGVTLGPRERHALAEITYEEGGGPERKRAIITFETANWLVQDKEFLEEPPNPGHVTDEVNSLFRMQIRWFAVRALALP